MIEVYAFEWCSCVYESAYAVQSLHATKRGAFKAMVEKANNAWQAGRESRLLFGKSQFVPLQNERWRVRTIKVESDD